MQEELEKTGGEQWAKTEASINQLLSEKHGLAEELRRTQQSLSVQSDGWQRERSKAMALMFSKRHSISCTCRRLATALCMYVNHQLPTGELPLSMLSNESTESTDGPGDASLSKKFPMVTLAQW